MLRAVIFDLDDTLIDWSAREGTWPEATRRHLEPVHAYLRDEGHPTPELAELAEIYQGQMRQMWQALGPPEWDCPPQTDILRETFRAAKLEADRIDIEHIQRLIAWDLLPGVRVYEDTVEVLGAIQAGGLKTGLVTNAAMPMWMRDSELRALGILDYLDVRLTAADVGKFKPHPYPFHVALTQLGIEADEAVFVGDRLQADVAGANAAGIRAVWIKRIEDNMADGSPTPDATITTLSELPGVLDDWHPGWRRLSESTEKITR